MLKQSSGKCQNCTENYFQYSKTILKIMFSTVLAFSRVFWKLVVKSAVSSLVWPFSHSCSCYVSILVHSKESSKNSLLYTRIETFSYTTCVEKAISAQRPNGKDTLPIKCREIISLNHTTFLGTTQSFKTIRQQL